MDTLSIKKIISKFKTNYKKTKEHKSYLMDNKIELDNPHTDHLVDLLHDIPDLALGSKHKIFRLNQKRISKNMIFNVH